MNKGVIGGIAAVVIVGGAFAANSVMNSKAEEAVQNLIADANQKSVSQVGKLSTEQVSCSVLFDDSCSLSGVQFSNYENPQQSFKVDMLTISGIKSYLAAASEGSDHALPMGKTNVGLTLKGISSLDGKTLNDVIATESPKFYSALTDDIKTALVDNAFHIQANVNNDVSSSRFISDDDVTLRFDNLPLSFKAQVKYTYNGDMAILNDPKAAMKNQANIIGLLSNFTVNNLSVAVEQGQYMFTDVFHGFYINYIDRCNDAERCTKRSNQPFPEPYNTYEKPLTSEEFEDALVKVVDSKQGDIYQQFERIASRSIFTPEELHKIAQFIVKGDTTMTIKLTNKNDAPVIGFADVIGRGMKSLRSKVDVEIQ
ncbi:hypothetical protein OAP63_00580 [Vibrio sp.]|uniref:DUF945 family protein n=1 Tax=Vibrio viridaestus TaxID=2487322 RepID=A0A3N9TFV6_9VIBR|nr:hypothetical protein [Vibrio viridaestus]MDC0609203.1 hypothetical protein [Vibrio sp.]RQW62355.1 hypothetical protein EES38_14340 [Vibrio viridaestus]